MEDSVANWSMERRVATIVHILTGNDKKWFEIGKLQEYLDFHL